MRNITSHFLSQIFLLQATKYSIAVLIRASLFNFCPFQQVNVLCEVKCWLLLTLSGTWEIVP